MGLERIGAIRKRLGMSIEELSEKSGVPIGTLSKISAGITTDPKLGTATAIARALNCTLEELDADFLGQQNVFAIFGMLLKQIRTKRGLTQQELSDELKSFKITEIDINEWEQGRGRISQNQYKRLCEWGHISYRSKYYIISEEFGAELEDGRKKSHYTLEAIAKHIGYSTEDIKRWEQGNYILPEIECQSLCRWYDIELPEAVSFPSSSKDFYKKEISKESLIDDLKTAYDDLSEQGVKKVLQYAMDIKNTYGAEKSKKSVGK